MRLTREAIAALIPHAGDMVLLDEVVEWDDARIACLTRTHLDAGNPLRIAGSLSSVCGIELAAQAMAVHGALLGRRDAPAEGSSTKPRAGFLASVRHVDLHVDRLDDVDGVITVEATRDSGDGSHVLYAFAIRSADAVLVSGRAAVVLDMGELAGP